MGGASRVSSAVNFLPAPAETVIGGKLKRTIIRLGVAGTLAALSVTALGIPAQAAEAKPARPGIATEAAVFRSVAAPPAVAFWFDAPDIGSLLSVDVGYRVGKPDPWSTPGTKLSYQWLRNGAVIPGATGDQYYPGRADTGKKISYKVTGSAPGYKPVTRTSETIVVPNKTLAPEIRYAATTPGSSLQAQLPEPWVTSVPVTMKYQWLRNGVPIPGATALKYTITAADLNKSIVLRARGISAGKTVESINSAPIRPSASKKQLTMTSMLLFSGPRKVGNSMEITTPSSSQRGVKTSYQWLRNGTVIPGATKQLYLPVDADAGKRLTVAITGSLAGYAPLTVQEGNWGNRILAGPPRTSAPTISGTARVGSVLTAKKGVWRMPTDVVFKWQRNGVDIKGATAATYKLTAADKGKKITVRSTIDSPYSPYPQQFIDSTPVVPRQ
jgi:hypothetical protein